MLFLILTVDTTFIFCQTYQYRTGFAEELGCMVTYVTQTLYNYFFTFDTGVQTDLLHVLSHVYYFTDTVEDTQSCSFRTAGYTTLAHRFTGHTTQRIDIAGIQLISRAPVP
jgi:hypothetical protein